MKRERRSKKPVTAPATPPEEHDGVEHEVTGWKASTAGLSGLTRLARAGAWLLVASGPLLGLLAMASTAAEPADSRKAPAVVKAASGVAPAGFAELYVAAYLEAGQGTESTLAPYYPTPVSLTNTPGARSANRTVAVATNEVSSGYWAVTVAAQVVSHQAGRPDTTAVQYFRVGVQAVGPYWAGGAAAKPDSTVGYAATSLPAQVAAPDTLSAGDLAYGTTRGNALTDPVVDTASSFLTAYLTGTGDLDRYSSPGTRLRPVSPAPYTAVKVTDSYDNSANGGIQSVPSDGTARRLLVNIAATNTAGQTYPLTYALDLRSRGGRWEVWALTEAPALKSGSAPSAAPRPTDPGTGTRATAPSAPAR
ncbi:conjugal transfer protein [Kitasatospora sp. MBT66]|uniref:conjugal transfer protein n=1 Tax=Kitasatospora sp. MBT66 TaxID=1444769 RepID=UPI0006894809|nr:conjugal transfer protein [Kitasatospora sp. MBT66]